MPTQTHKPIVQKKWVKGLISCTPNLAQVPNSVPRITNMVFSVRGGLKACDGSDIYTQALTTTGDADPTGHGAFLAIDWVPVAALGNIANTGNNVLALQAAPLWGLSAPSAPTLSPVSGGGLANGAYIVSICATDGFMATGQYRQTTAGTQSITLSGGNGTISATWSAVPNAVGYVVYITFGGFTFSAGFVSATSYTFTSLIPFQLATVPLSNNTQSTVIRTTQYSNLGGIYGYGTILSTNSGVGTRFPSSPVSPSGIINSLYSPNGGLVGAVSAIPQIMTFAGYVILILGNGMPPQYLTSNSFGALPNNYVVSYPTWTASTSYQVDDLIQPATPNGYYFQCLQAGVSGSVEPTWNATIGAVTNDVGALQWSCVASTTVVAPRGAAHGIVYAGSLWLWNTSPATTTDQLDGPSCLKMSILNDPTSWDPLNVAFVDKDDGDEGMGMSVFSISESGIAPTNNLVLFKSYKTYVVAGVFGSSQFSIQRVQTDMGCIAPRSIQFVPGLGIVRLTHLGFATTDGISDRVISEEIRPYLFGGDPTITPVDLAYMPYAQATQTANPPMYICGLSRGGNNGLINTLFCYDLVQLSWTVINLPFNVYNITQIRPGATGTFQGFLTQLGGYTDGVIRNWQNQDSTWDAFASPNSTSIAWMFKTPEVYSTGGSDPFFLKKVALRGVAASPNATITLVRQGSQDAQIQRTRQWQCGANQFIMQSQPNARLMNVAAVIQGTGPTEIDLVEWLATPKPEGTPLNFMK